MRIAVVAPSSRFGDGSAVEARVGDLAAAVASGRRARLPSAMRPRRPSFRRHRRGARGGAGRGRQRSRLRRDLVRPRRLWLLPDRRSARWPRSARRRATRPGSAIAMPASCSRRSTAPAFRRRARADAAGHRARGRRGGGRAGAGLAGPTRPERARAGLEPGRRHAAFNITVLGMLLGTPLEPDLADHVLLLEEVSEHMLCDRPGAVPSHREPAMSARVAGIRLGRVSDVLPNDPDFGA